MRPTAKKFLLVGILSLLAYLTLTKSGRGAASYIGSRIVDLSQAGIDAIAGREGFSATPYRDATGYSIGFGHFILPGENFTSITRSEGLALLAQDTAKADAAVKRLVNVPLTSNQHDALVSFVYNAGINAFAGSTLLRKLNVGDYSGAANQFAVWDKSHTPSGSFVTNLALEARRASEKAQFLA